MPEYRKELNGRCFYKSLGEGNVIRVMNKHDISDIKVGFSLYIESEVFGIDPEIKTVPCTEEEFNAAKSEAMKRLNEEQI